MISAGSLRGELQQRAPALVLLWLGGFGIRVTILAVPPVISSIHRSLGLNEKGITALTNLPVLMLALMAVPAGIGVSRLGAPLAAGVGLAVVSVAGALRGVGPNLAVVFAMTAVMGAGVALVQGSLPTLARAWFPRHVGLATAVYSNGLLVGEVIPASLTGIALLPLLSGRWGLDLAVWSLPVMAGALLFLFLAPRLKRPERASSARAYFRSSSIWRVGVTMSFASAAYFGANSFVPDYLRAVGHARLTTAALAALNLSQLPASVLVLAIPERLVGRRAPFIVSGVIISCAGVLLVLTSGVWTVVWVGVMGFATSLTLILTLALPALLATSPADVNRLTAALFTITYGFSFAWAIAGSALWDSYHLPSASFLTLAAGGVVMALLSSTTDIRPAIARVSRSDS